MTGKTRNTYSFLFILLLQHVAIFLLGLLAVTMLCAK